MKFEPVQLATLLTEIAELPASSADELGAKVLAYIPECLARLRKNAMPPSTENLASEFAANPLFLDVCRLFIGKAQEPVAHTICEQIGRSAAKWNDLRRIAKADPQSMADAMQKLGVPDLITTEIQKKWSAEEMLAERYRLTRGRAMSGQSRGRSLEDDVDRVLTELNVPAEKRKTFTGKDGKQAKCDLAIPSKLNPKIVIEAKGFEATGSKLTDFLGDVLKIAEAKAYHMYFFVVTDGRGWHNRESDLKRLVEFHHRGLIDMIYTRARLPELARDVKKIYDTEM